MIAEIVILWTRKDQNIDISVIAISRISLDGIQFINYKCGNLFGIISIACILERTKIMNFDLFVGGTMLDSRSQVELDKKNFTAYKN